MAGSRLHQGSAGPTDSLGRRSFSEGGKPGHDAEICGVREHRDAPGSMQWLQRLINPFFENDADVVLPTPGEAAFSDREKVIKRDEEICRKKSQAV
jgi:hypothetical protein